MTKRLNSVEHKMRRESHKFQRGETKEQRIDLAKVLKLQNINTFKESYNYLLKNFPEGLTGAENIVPVTIDGNKMELVIFEPMDDYVSFGLFLPNQKYSRKTLEINEDGQVNEDKIGIIPDFDLVENEPKFTSSDKEIVITTIEEIKKKFDKKTIG